MRKVIYSYSSYWSEKETFRSYGAFKFFSNTAVQIELIFIPSSWLQL